MIVKPEGEVTLIDAMVPNSVTLLPEMVAAAENVTMSPTTPAASGPTLWISPATSMSALGIHQAAY